MAPDRFSRRFERWSRTQVFYDAGELACIALDAGGARMSRPVLVREDRLESEYYRL